MARYGHKKKTIDTRRYYTKYRDTIRYGPKRYVAERVVATQSRRGAASAMRPSRPIKAFAIGYASSISDTVRPPNATPYLTTMLLLTFNTQVRSKTENLKLKNLHQNTLP